MHCTIHWTLNISRRDGTLITETKEETKKKEEECRLNSNAPPHFFLRKHRFIFWFHCSKSNVRLREKGNKWWRRKQIYYYSFSFCTKFPIRHVMKTDQFYWNATSFSIQKGSFAQRPFESIGWKLQKEIRKKFSLKMMKKKKEFDNGLFGSSHTTMAW